MSKQLTRRELEDLSKYIKAEQNKIAFKKDWERYNITENANAMLNESKKYNRLDENLKKLRDFEDKRLAEENKNFAFDKEMEKLPGISDIEKIPKSRFSVPSNFKESDINNYEDELEGITGGTRRKSKKSKKNKKNKKSKKRTLRFRKSKK